MTKRWFNKINCIFFIWILRKEKQKDVGREKKRGILTHTHKHTHTRLDWQWWCGFTPRSACMIPKITIQTKNRNAVIPLHLDLIRETAKHNRNTPTILWDTSRTHSRRGWGSTRVITVREWDGKEQRWYSNICMQRLISTCFTLGGAVNGGRERALRFSVSFRWEKLWPNTAADRSLSIENRNF